MNNFLEHLDTIAGEDVAGLNKAQQSYGDSWKKRGGVGAFMMLARKWDRLENRVKEEIKSGFLKEGVEGGKSSYGSGDFEDRIEAHSWDIFEHIAADDRAEGLIDDIRDLRRYLMLVEAEMRCRGSKAATSTHRDNTSMPSAPSPG